MKCHILFSGKNKKNISKCRLLKILPRVLSVNIMLLIAFDKNLIHDILYVTYHNYISNLISNVFNYYYSTFRIIVVRLQIFQTDYKLYYRCTGLFCSPSPVQLPLGNFPSAPALPRVKITRDNLPSPG